MIRVRQASMWGVGAATVMLTVVPGTLRSQERPNRYLFEEVTLISPATGTALSPAWVGVEGDRFVVVSDGEPGGWVTAERIDGRGMFLIPGLVDAHVHTDKLQDLAALLVHGVTTARLGRGNPTHLRWRDAVRSGSVPGPRLLVGSPYVWDRGPDGFGLATPNPETVRGHVARLQREGYDLIKVVDVYDHHIAEALFAEARKLGIPVFGHVADDETVPFDWAWTAGLGYTTLEHLDEVVRLALSSSADPAELEAFIGVAREAGVVFTSLLRPVFSRARAYTRAADGQPAYSAEQEARAFIVSGGGGRSELRRRSTELRSRSRKSVEAEIPDTARLLRVFDRLASEGVVIVPGTEGGGVTEWAGATLHDELDLFVQGGMTPMQALRAATAQAARILEVEDLEGDIRVGTIADAVLVSEDPREGLAGLRRPEGVMVSGRWYDPDELYEMRQLFGLVEEDHGDREIPDPTHPLFGSGSATHPAVAPDRRRLAFMSYRDGNAEVYSMGGSNQRNRTRAPSAEHTPDWQDDRGFVATQTNLIVEQLRTVSSYNADVEVDPCLTRGGVMPGLRRTSTGPGRPVSQEIRRWVAVCGG